MDSLKLKISTATARQEAISKDTLQKFVEIETKERRYVLQEGLIGKYSCVVFEKKSYKKRGKLIDQALEVDGDFELEDGLGYLLKQLLKFEEMNFNDIV